MNLAIELTPPPTLDELLPLFGSWPGLVVFDSAKPSHPLGRYSYLSADPVRTFEVTRASYGLDPFVEIRETLAGFEAAIIPVCRRFRGELRESWRMSWGAASSSCRKCRMMSSRYRIWQSGSMTGSSPGTIRSSGAG